MSTCVQARATHKLCLLQLGALYRQKMFSMLYVGCAPIISRTRAIRFEFFGGYFGAGHVQVSDEVANYVRINAPERLDELETHYSFLRPSGEIDKHIAWYSSQQNKQRFIDHARLAYQLIAKLPRNDGHELALQYARFILGFYEYEGFESLDLDHRMAKNMIWWHENTGDKVVYWGGIAHNYDLEKDSTFHIVGPLAKWFDIIIHFREITSARNLF